MFYGCTANYTADVRAYMVLHNIKTFEEAEELYDEEEMKKYEDEEEEDFETEEDGEDN